VLEVFYHHAEFVGLWILHTAMATKNVEFFVCLSIMLVNNRICAYNFTLKALDYRNNFVTVGYGKVCSLATALNFLRMSPIGNTTNAEVQKLRNLGFSATRV